MASAIRAKRAFLATRADEAHEEEEHDENVVVVGEDEGSRSEFMGRSRRAKRKRRFSQIYHEVWRAAWLSACAYRLQLASP
ncbi:hypothetical protein AKJ09_08835 [Labilithrix luteola]|uniref:Uncharacterized protein n=1 Tax=Labilithrix luteola TaxID=1391654 RepID=A0A0K1Q913_9BACT|nr:hypothetical protein AKJ09_08835 [Labilithrix luteola]